MSWMLEDREKKIQEENRQARAGGCIALILLAFICPGLCWVLGTYTSGGQIITAYGLAYYAHNGLPLGSLTPGLTEIARQSCDLDQASPQPANLTDEQDRLAKKYESQLKMYHQNWNKLQKLEQDTSMFEAPDQIPGNLLSAKILYCTR